MKLWIDDVRRKPANYNFWAKNYDEAIRFLDNYNIEHVSFDHDLGEGKTGYDVANWIDKKAYEGRIEKMSWDVHSANPVGRKNIELAMKSAERWW